MVKVFTTSRFRISKRAVTSYAKGYLQKYGVHDSYDMNIVFIGSRKMRSVAKKYKGEDKVLPVLSFPYADDELKFLGEIFICYPQLVLLAAERDKTIDQTAEQLVKHGIDTIMKA